MSYVHFLKPLTANVMLLYNKHSNVIHTFLTTITLSLWEPGGQYYSQQDNSVTTNVFPDKLCDKQNMDLPS